MMWLTNNPIEWKLFSVRWSFATIGTAATAFALAVITGISNILAFRLLDHR